MEDTSWASSRPSVLLTWRPDETGRAICRLRNQRVRANACTCAKDDMPIRQVGSMALMCVRDMCACQMHPTCAVGRGEEETSEAGERGREGKITPHQQNGAVTLAQLSLKLLFLCLKKILLYPCTRLRDATH